jgi:hypothetical protein
MGKKVRRWKADSSAIFVTQEESDQIDLEMQSRLRAENIHHENELRQARRYFRRNTCTRKG